MKATLILCLLCLFTYIFIGLINFFYSIEVVEEIVKFYGFSLNNLKERPYVLFTSIFIHGSIEHLISNLLVLLFFGVAVEDEIGAKKMLIIFFSGAIAGDLLSILFYPPEVVSIGASAGIFALVGFGMIIRPLDLSFYPPFYIIPLGLLGILYAIYNTIGFIFNVGNISYIAHFGGLFTGVAFAYRHKNWKKGLKIILFMIILMILLPLIIMYLFNL
ncbi:MAG: rhomboid family intramembrane serine protease [Candidatus Aenigmatarchaeota archaeon]|nr:rhomboid family intramembrane serine protease [Candidatus Aenigmarchaeota archaeon]